MTRFLTESNELRLERWGMGTSTMRPALVVRLTRFRVVAIAVLGLLTLVTGISVWRMRSVDELPDVGDPFDVTQALRPIAIPDRENAYAAYALARFDSRIAPAELWDVTWKCQIDALTWSKAKLELRAFQQSNRATLQIWRDGSERADALYRQPSEMAFVSLPLHLLVEAFLHSGMSALEGSRLEEQAAMADAWVWYRAMLRSSRLVGRHGAFHERRYGAQMHELAARCILRWAADPRVDAAMLRRALDEVSAADRLTPPLSDTLKLEYLMALRDLDELIALPKGIPLPGGQGGLLSRVPPSVITGEIQRFRFRASNDTERSRRALRLVFANWLAQVDRPAAERARSAKYAGLLIYEADRTAPPAAWAVTPLVLSEAIDHTILARSLFRPDNLDRNVDQYGSWEGDGSFARERRRRSVLLVRLAAELYRRELGKPPANAGDVLGGYLKELPEGVGRDDPIPGGVE
jgi:hypothetical protein